MGDPGYEVKGDYFYNFSQLPEGVEWSQITNGELSKSKVESIRKQMWGEAKSDPLDQLIGTWVGPAVMGPIPIEKTNFNNIERTTGVPEIWFTDHFTFERIGAVPSTVKYSQTAYATSEPYKRMLIHSETGYFRWFPEAPSIARKFDFEQCRAVGRGIVTISQGNLNKNPTNNDKLEFTMNSATQGGFAQATYASLEGGITENGTPQQRSPRGFGVPLSTTNKWRITQDGKLAYHLLIEVQNPEIVFDPSDPNSAPGTKYLRSIKNEGMKRVIIQNPDGTPATNMPGPKCPVM